MGLTTVLVAAAGFAPADRWDGELPFYGQAVDWQPCFTPEELAAAEDTEGDPDWTSRLECGTVTVPVDHGDPEGGTIDMAVVRHPAQGPAEQRRGSLVFDFGGPGVPGVERMRSGPLPLSRQTRASFDLVSFDPRGVGESAGFTCPRWRAMRAPLEALRNLGAQEVTDARLRELDKAAEAYARSCVEEVGEEFLANTGTVNVVRDLDILRDALGDRRLNYVGFSYGTRIGALYAEMFAENTRALVLDGAMQIERDVVADGVEQSGGVQAAWEAFVDYCLERAPECPFTDAARASAETEAILSGVAADPVVLEEGGVGRHELLVLLREALYTEHRWENAARLLARLAAGDTGDEFVRGYLEGALAPRDGGSGPEESAFTAVRCADHTNPTDPRDYREGARRAADLSPLFGGDQVWSLLPCAHWPVTEVVPTGVSAPMAPPILVVGTRGDPATPYAWARELADQLASATLFTYEGGGHTAYAGGRSCVDRVVDAYLLYGEVPPTGSSCPGEF
ncbi:alpha/beta fold hydrolase [Nocardiopsis terrae]